MSGTEYGKTVTLGRRIVTVTGKIVEACDFNFASDETNDDDCLMLAAAVVLLSGNTLEDEKAD